MKNLLASGIFVFLGLCANLNAEYDQEQLRDYLKERIYWLNFQLDDQSLDQNSEYAGFLFGEREAYRDILNKIKNNL